MPVVMATPSAIPTPTPTPMPTPTPVPTSTPAGSCVLVCPAVPTPSPQPTPDQATAASFRLHVPILEYHRIKPSQGERGYRRDLITPPGLFSAQLDAMAAAGWKTITMGELGDDLRFGISPPPKTFVITIDDGYADGYQNAMPILLAHGYVATYFVIAGRIGLSGFMSASQVRSLADAGMEIGNHSYTHRDLASLPADQLPREVEGASAVIANITGTWPGSFSYPKGFDSPDLNAALKACPGLTTAVIETGSKPQTWNNRWQLPRIRVGPGMLPSDLLARTSRY